MYILNRITARMAAGAVVYLPDSMVLAAVRKFHLRMTVCTVDRIGAGNGGVDHTIIIWRAMTGGTLPGPAGDRLDHMFRQRRGIVAAPGAAVPCPETIGDLIVQGVRRMIVRVFRLCMAGDAGSGRNTGFQDRPGGMTV